MDGAFDGAEVADFSDENGIRSTNPLTSERESCSSKFTASPAVYFRSS